MEIDWDDDGCEDQTFADPNIRVEYEAALGRLILAHNEVDFRLTKALERVVLRIAPDRSLIKFATGTFAQRLNNLEMFQKISANLYAVRVDVTKLRTLNAIRNDVAHGHFDQDPFDGSFTIIGDGRGTGKKPSQYEATTLHEAEKALLEIASTLKVHEVFGDLPRTYVLPPNAKQV